jgi:hypothetical protein
MVGVGVFVYRECANKGTVTMALIALMLSLSHHPLDYSPVYPATIALTLAIFTLVRFTRDVNQLEYVYINSLLLVLASFFIPPILWLVPVFALANLTIANDKPRYLVSVLLGLVTLPAFYFGTLAIVNGFESISIASIENYFNRLFDVDILSVSGDTATIIKNCVVIIIAGISLFGLLVQLFSYGSRYYKPLIRLLISFVSIAILSFLFADSIGVSSVIPFYLISSLVITQHLYSSISRIKGNFMFVFMTIIVVTERLFFLFRWF